MVSQIYMYIKMYQNLHLIMGILYLNKAVFKNDNFRKMYEAITLLVLGWNPKSDNLPPPIKERVERLPIKYFMSGKKCAAIDGR